MRRPRCFWRSVARLTVVFFASVLFLTVEAAHLPRLGRSSSPAEKKPVKVWAIVPSKVYHCPESRWYGKGRDGKYLDECQAIKEGYRPAFGQGCGSKCLRPFGSD